MSVVEIEVHGKRGSRLFFHPVGKPLRGHINFREIDSKAIRAKGDKWTKPVPGKVIGVNLSTGERYIREPLHEPEHRETRAKIEKSNSLPPEKEVYNGETQSTWFYWMRRAVDNGDAVLLKGELPTLASFEGEKPKPVDDGKPRKNFILPEPEKGISLAEVLERSTAVNEKLLELLTKLVEKGK
jgi:hypothetical protein